MRVCITTKHKNYDCTDTGKGFFLKRLSNALIKLGVDVVTDPNKDVDIDLQTGKYHYDPINATKSILRLGAVHLDKNQDWKALNKLKRRSMKKADGVVYQSRFSKKCCKKFIGKPKGKEATIFNGADPDYYFGLKKYHSAYRFNFVSVTRNWKRFKRLKDIIKSFLMAEISDSALFIAGSTEKIIRDKRIFYLGKLNHRTLGGLYRMAHAMIHIVFADACPNSVVESLVAGCPVICNNVGGTHELSDFVMELDLEKEWNYKPINLNKPPKIDREKLAQGIRDAAYPHSETVIYSSGKIGEDRLFIDTIAKHYITFFKEVLYG
jgi:glycosyltransferase involved in cell wall biosynthesis